MSENIRFVVIVTAALMCLGLFSAKAQVLEPGPFDGKEIDKEELLKKIEEIREKKLAQKLELSDKQAEILFPLLQEYEKNERALLKERRESYKRLHHLSELDDSDESKIKQEMVKIKEIETKLLALKEKMLGDTEAVLSTRQVGKLIIFQEKFHHRVREIVKGIRAGRKKGGGGRFKKDSPFGPGGF